MTLAPPHPSHSLHPPFSLSPLTATHRSISRSASWSPRAPPPPPPHTRTSPFEQPRHRRPVPGQFHHLLQVLLVERHVPLLHRVCLHRPPHPSQRRRVQNHPVAIPRPAVLGIALQGVPSPPPGSSGGGGGQVGDRDRGWWLLCRGVMRKAGRRALRGCGRSWSSGEVFWGQRKEEGDEGHRLSKGGEGRRRWRLVERGLEVF